MSCLLHVVTHRIFGAYSLFAPSLVRSFVLQHTRTHPGMSVSHATEWVQRGTEGGGMGCFFSLSLTVSHITLSHIGHIHPCAHFYTIRGRGAGRRGAGRFKGGSGVASCAGWLATQSGEACDDGQRYKNIHVGRVRRVRGCCVGLIPVS